MNTAHPKPAISAGAHAFKYVCRGCGEGWFIPQSTVRCPWCETPDPFGGDPAVCRPAIVPATRTPTTQKATS